MNKYKEHSLAAQENYRRFRGCESKKTYNSPESAHVNGQEIYQCPHCNCWHRSGKFATFMAAVKRREVSHRSF